MTAAMHLDTHVVVWLYAGEHERFPETLRARLNSDPLVASPMVRLELTYLNEVGRISEPAHHVLTELGSAIGLTEDEKAPFPAVVSAAERLTWTRDPFDRLIAAHAVAAHATLATKDASIRRRLPDLAVWD